MGLVITDGEKFYKIPKVNSPQQVIWENKENAILVDQETIFRYNFPSRVLHELDTRQPNEFVGLDDKNNLLFCRIEHYMINSYDEYSTKFVIFNNQRDIVKELAFFETIRPIQLNSSTILAVTALDFLEEHFYKIDISTGKYEEIDKPLEPKLYFDSELEIKNIYWHKSRYIFENSKGDLLHR